MTQHTPGPWVYKGGETTTIREADGSMICQMKFLTGPHGLGGRRSNDEVDANARLIAAAPDMLAELQRLHAKNGWQSTADIIARVISKEQNSGEV
jgi:hypothetical protein